MKKLTLFLIALMSVVTINATAYLKGSFNNWGTGNQFSSGIAKITLNANQTYEFKINDGNYWYGNNGTMSNQYNTDWIFSTNDGNAKIKTQSKGEYIFIWDSSKKSVSVIYPDFTHYITGTKSLMGDSEWKGNEKEMTKESDCFQFTFPNVISKGSHEFKITRGNWDWSIGSEKYDNDSSNVDNTGTGNVKIELKNDAHVTIKLSFNLKISVKLAYDITVTPGKNGTVTGGGTYNHGTTATIEATPNAGYEFVEWNDGNTDNPRTITNITSNQSYTATFSRKDRTFSDPSTLEVGTYGKLTYQLPMPDNQWYWISLPFDVNVDEITVDGATNGVKNSDALVITEYDAEARAAGKQGWTNIKSNILEANKGYVMGPTDGAYNANMVVNFPSAATTNDVNSSAKNTLTSTGGNTQNDNWYIIGTGLYHQGSLSNINYVAMPTKNDKGEDTYEYKYISSGNELFTEKLGTNSFAPFTAFFVQYGGDYSATKETTQSAALAPVARAKAQEQEQIYLINMNEAHTVVILNAEGSEGYTAGEDFLEMNASNHSDLIYSFDGSDALAFNHRATEAQSINLGGYVATAGEQTISLKGYNANVESVTLVDNVTGETADLLAGDYTFNAEVGSLDGRFTVVFGTQKADDTTVDCYNSTANQLIAYGSANACTVSGLTTGEAIAIYNAMGQLVFATIADSETITLPSLTTGNYLILHNGTTNKVLLK